MIKYTNGNACVCGLSTRTNSPTKKSNKKENTHNKYIKRGPDKKCVKIGKIFSANCAGCQSKTQILVDNVNHIGTGIFTL